MVFFSFIVLVQKISFFCIIPFCLSIILKVSVSTFKCFNFLILYILFIFFLIEYQKILMPLCYEIHLQNQLCMGAAVSFRIDHALLVPKISLWRYGSLR